MQRNVVHLNIKKNVSSFSMAVASQVFPAGQRPRTRQTGSVIWCFWRAMSINLR